MSSNPLQKKPRRSFKRFTLTDYVTQRRARTPSTHLMDAGKMSGIKFDINIRVNLFKAGQMCCISRMDVTPSSWERNKSRGNVLSSLPPAPTANFHLSLLTFSLFFVDFCVCWSVSFCHFSFSTTDRDTPVPSIHSYSLFWITLAFCLIKKENLRYFPWLLLNFCFWVTLI